MQGRGEDRGQSAKSCGVGAGEEVGTDGGHTLAFLKAWQEMGREMEDGS